MRLCTVTECATNVIAPIKWRHWRLRPDVTAFLASSPRGLVFSPTESSWAAGVVGYILWRLRKGRHDAVGEAREHVCSHSHGIERGERGLCPVVMEVG